MRPVRQTSHLFVVTDPEIEHGRLRHKNLLFRLPFTELRLLPTWRPHPSGSAVAFAISQARQVQLFI